MADRMTHYEQMLWWRPIPIGDPIGPWLREALLQELINPREASALTITRIGLEKEALSLQRQALDLHEKALDSIAEVAQKHKQA